MTDIVFGEVSEAQPSDLILVFGSTHPGCAEQALNAYKLGLGAHMVVTGGRSQSENRYKGWEYGMRSEGSVLAEKLIAGGVPPEAITVEDQSGNSKENVLFAARLHDFTKTGSLVFIAKNYGVGRQSRTLRKYLPASIQLSSLGYPIFFEDGSTFGREDWIHHAKGKALVFGEYLRIRLYGSRGDIEALETEVEGLDSDIQKLLLQ